jgi:hypothetical protein
VRLAVVDLVGGHEHPRRRQPCCPHPAYGELARRGGHHRPRHLDARQQHSCTRDLHDALHGAFLAALEVGDDGANVVLGGGREELAHRVRRTAPVRPRHELGLVHAVLAAEVTPDRLDHRRRVDERAVHVEQRRRGGQLEQIHGLTTLVRPADILRRSWNPAGRPCAAAHRLGFLLHQHPDRVQHVTRSFDAATVLDVGCVG